MRMILLAAILACGVGCQKRIREVRAPAKSPAVAIAGENRPA